MHSFLLDSIWIFTLQRFAITCKLHQPHVNVLEEWLIYMQNAQEIDP